MNISQLLESLKDPTIALTISEKLLAGVCVALLSMSVVFIVLVIISAIINILQREKKEVKPIQNVVTSEAEMVKDSSESEDMGELVSVITAAICAATGNSSNNIIVRKIIRSNNCKSSWESMQKKATK